MLQKRGTAIDRVLNFVVPDSVLVRAACAQSAVSLAGRPLPGSKGWAPYSYPWLPPAPKQAALVLCSMLRSVHRQSHSGRCMCTRLCVPGSACTSTLQSLWGAK